MQTLVIASEAIQSRGASPDRFVATLLAMTMRLELFPIRLDQKQL
jgi:hypothetical protein